MRILRDLGIDVIAGGRHDRRDRLLGGHPFQLRGGSGTLDERDHHPDVVSHVNDREEIERPGGKIQKQGETQQQAVQPEEDGGDLIVTLNELNEYEAIVLE